MIRKWPIRGRLCVSVPFSRTHSLKNDIFSREFELRDTCSFLPFTLDSHFEIALFDT